jgi:pimeloyl-ACP methyl ester carboxylesterase
MSNSMTQMRGVRRTSQSLYIVLLLLTCGALSAQNEGHRVRNIVLVRGAWADGSGWKGVYDILVKDGYNVSIVQEPETSFKDDVAATRRALAQQDGPCILVAHSYGGAVITEAGTDPSVAGLVYVAAHMPDGGANEADDGKRFPSDLSKSTAIKKTADGFTYGSVESHAMARKQERLVRTPGREEETNGIHLSLDGPTGVAGGPHH